MQHYINQLLFGYYPYIATVIFILGCLGRYEYVQYGWRSGSSQLLRNRGMRIGSNFFHVGIILLLSGHFIGLLMPESLYHPFISSGSKQLIAMTAGGIFGSVAFIGLTMLVVRRLFDARVRAQSSFMDILILLLLYVQLIIGLISISVSAQHPDGSSMVALANWVQHTVTFQSDAASYLLGVNFIFKLHIFLGLTILLLFPFTRLVHILSAPIGYLFRVGYQIVRKRL